MHPGQGRTVPASEAEQRRITIGMMRVDTRRPPARARSHHRHDSGGITRAPRRPLWAHEPLGGCGTRGAAAAQEFTAAVLQPAGRAK
jgi:hypothetical protein